MCASLPDPSCYGCLSYCCLSVRIMVRRSLLCVCLCPSCCDVCLVIVLVVRSCDDCDVSSSVSHSLCVRDL